MERAHGARATLGAALRQEGEPPCSATGGFPPEGSEEEEEGCGRLAVLEGILLAPPLHELD